MSAGVAQPIDPAAWSAIDSWPAAVAVVALILAVLVVPQVGAWVQARRSASAVDEVRRTLTTNNGGSHVKDALDRIEHTQADLVARVTVLEHAAEKRRGRVRWR